MEGSFDMENQPRGWTDQQVEHFVGALLLVGVLVSATCVVVGGVVYLYRHAGEPPEYHEFIGEPPNLRSLKGVAAQVWAFRGRGIIQLGLLLLIATPLARVIFSVLAFARQRDWTYVVVTLLVLAVLLFSLFGESSWSA